MQPVELILQIRNVMDRLGVEVREGYLGGSGGGLCRIRGRRVVFVDLDADVASTLDVMVAALTALPEAEGVFLPPALRDLVDKHKTQSP